MPSINYSSYQLLFIACNCNFNVSGKGSINDFQPGCRKEVSGVPPNLALRKILH
jgi:hypothetical protein